MQRDAVGVVAGAVDRVEHPGKWGVTELDWGDLCQGIVGDLAGLFFAEKHRLGCCGRKVVHDGLLDVEVGFGDDVAVGFVGDAPWPVRVGQCAGTDGHRLQRDLLVAVELGGVWGWVRQRLHLVSGGPCVGEDGGEFGEQVRWCGGGSEHECG